MLPQASTEFYATQQRVNATAANEVARAWRRMGDDLDASWRRNGPNVLAVLLEAQAQNARAALAYVPRVLDETGVADLPSGDPRLSRFVGVASDGRRLDTLAYGAVTQSKQAITNGASTAQGLQSGGDWLDLMVKLQVADVARQVVGVMTASRKNLGGTVRVPNPPSCQRCAILAGRWYRWSKGFDRHPRCDCVNQPVPSEAYAKAEGFLSDPMGAYRRGEIRGLTEAQKFALDQPGADIGQIVNATRGMSTTTTYLPIKQSAKRVQGPIKPGQPDLLAQLAGLPRASAVGRVTPEGIYREAKTRDAAIVRLRAEGYIT